MDEYELIYESLCDAVDNGEIDAEFAEAVNDLAYDKYVNENTRMGKEGLKLYRLADEYKKRIDATDKKYIKDFYYGKLRKNVSDHPISMSKGKAVALGRKNKALNTDDEYDRVYNNNGIRQMLNDKDNYRIDDHGTTYYPYVNTHKKQYGYTKMGVAKSGYKNSNSGPSFK